ncbi:MAG: four helix bundle protein [Bacteroidetes bacterium HGW-Bacteroidetes-1]|jgi:four helix bundle protein|nr:MAG: four helix bundle protein [Bacteroidetes bacterium HGW-Bacteroidetes-1]
MKLEDFKVYQMAMEIGEEIWNIVTKWDYFAKDTIGKQFVRAIDSVAANLSEGFGRYHYREAKNFSYYSRGSLYESKTWLTKAHNRNLIETEDYKRISAVLESIGVKLNNYIKSIGKTSTSDDQQ